MIAGAELKKLREHLKSIDENIAAIKDEMDNAVKVAEKSEAHLKDILKEARKWK